MNTTLVSQNAATLQQIKVLAFRIFSGPKSCQVIDSRRDALFVLNLFESGKIQPWDANNRLRSICRIVMRGQGHAGNVNFNGEAREIINHFAARKKPSPIPSEFYGYSIVKYADEGGQKKAVVLDFWDNPLVEPAKVNAKPLQLEE